MALTARLTSKLPPTAATQTQRQRVEAEANARNLALGVIVREAIDTRYGLVNGEEVPAER